MQLLKLIFKNSKSIKIPSYKKKNARIELIGPFNNILYSIDFVNSDRAIDMFTLVLKDCPDCPQGPFKLIYYNVSSGIAMAERYHELDQIPPNAVNIFCEYAAATL
ncbi:hypothetical protein SAMN05428988_1294 [Chitinophaga sp. YR573]|uniref:hypothetical protein n=1 Tax=Chitinophaga sp. YR573 TaxID=1881040 RepID=UPI0008CA3607|nr:hypothetical protein [Chitinophaga sp. YR573]SEW01732.1 hypothetical protein SAMN05428988_1294 [Chitinophaga sp. YR573]